MRMDEIDPKRLPETAAVVMEEEKVKTAKAAKEATEREEAAAANGGARSTSLEPKGDAKAGRQESMKRRKLHWETIPKERLSKRRESTVNFVSLQRGSRFHRCLQS